MDAMNILITGGNGYIGKSLATHLSGGHSVTAISRTDFDLSSSSDTMHWFKTKFFDVVIHTAISGGSRLRADGADVLDNNLRMYYNLLENRGSYGKLISLGSGAELMHRESMYGLSKHVIRTSILGQDNFYNIRIYGLFDENELPTRFIKANIARYIAKNPMVILQDRYMDFFYMQDFYKVITYYLDAVDAPREYNCCYEVTPRLSDIASVINTMDNYTVDIAVTTPSLSTAYSAGYPRKLLPLNFVGLDAGIRAVYTTLCNQ